MFIRLYDNIGYINIKGIKSMRNKRKTLIWGLCALVGAFILLGYIYYIRLPEFHIMHSYSTSYTMQDGTRCRDTDLNVIVYKNFNDEELYKRIEYEHNRINGEPTELKIDLYKYEIKNNEPYKTITIDYINNTVEIE